MSLDTNIPQNEGIKTIFKAYENFYGQPIPTHYLNSMKTSPFNTKIPAQHVTLSSPSLRMLWFPEYTKRVLLQTAHCILQNY